MQCHCDKSSSSGSHFAGSPRESDWSPARRPCACKSMARRPCCQLVFNLQSVPPFKVDADENESHHALSLSPQRGKPHRVRQTSSRHVTAACACSACYIPGAHLLGVLRDHPTLLHKHTHNPSKPSITEYHFHRLVLLYCGGILPPEQAILCQGDTLWTAKKDSNYGFLTVVRSDLTSSGPRVS